MAENNYIKISIQRKVERFVGGDWNPHDLDTIFLWLRARTFGSKIIKDLGDFVAHADEKDRGLASEMATLMSNVFRGVISSLGQQNGKTFDDLEQYKNQILARFKLDTPSNIHKRFRFGQRKAKQELHSALSKMQFFEGDCVGYNLTNNEKQIIDYYEKHINIRIAYDEQQLVSEFIYVLRKNCLLTENQEADVNLASQSLAIWAIEKMHSCNLKIDEAVSSQLFAAVRQENDNYFLEVVCETKADYNGELTTITTEMFTTNCTASDWMDDDLWEKAPIFTIIEPIEIGPEGKLSRFV